MRLDITRKTDLAVRALRVLDGVDGRVKGSRLAELINSTPGFVPQVVAPLVKKRWVRSDPGPTGGYVLIVGLDEISLLDVIEAVEGPTDVDLCVLDGGPCDEAERCAVHDAWNRARDQLLAELRTTPLTGLQQRWPGSGSSVPLA